MNRRGFFGTLAGLLAAPFVAKAVAPKLIGQQYQFGAIQFGAIQSIAYDSETGIGIRYIGYWDMDALLGYAPLYPEWSCRILSDNDPSYRLTAVQRQFNPARLPV